MSIKKMMAPEPDKISPAWIAELCWWSEEAADEIERLRKEGDAAMKILGDLAERLRERAEARNWIAFDEEPPDCPACRARNAEMTYHSQDTQAPPPGKHPARRDTDE